MCNIDRRLQISHGRPCRRHPHMLRRSTAGMNKKPQLQTVMRDESCFWYHWTLFAYCWGSKLISCSIIFERFTPFSHPQLCNGICRTNRSGLSRIFISRSLFASPVNCEERRPQEHHQFLQLLHVCRRWRRPCYNKLKWLASYLRVSILLQTTSLTCGGKHSSARCGSIVICRHCVCTFWFSSQSCSRCAAASQQDKLQPGARTISGTYLCWS